MFGCSVLGTYKPLWRIVLLFLSFSSVNALKLLPDAGTFTNWIEHFEAADTQYTAWCKTSMLHGRRDWNKGSQFDQDVIVFRNLFAERAVKGEKGFYIEAGANHWMKLSNTLFYDKCLGWSGLCIEPNPEYHAGLMHNRSCFLLKECINKEEGDYTFDMTNGPGGSLRNGGTTKVHCRPLSAMLADAGRSHVDLAVFDVEGSEMDVLSTLGVGTTMSAVLVENNHLDGRKLDLFMQEKGFSKFLQMPVDGLYTPQTETQRPWLPDLKK